MRPGKHGRKWGWILILSGLLLFLWPDINALLFQNEAQRTIEEWKESKEASLNWEEVPIIREKSFADEKKEEKSGKADDEKDGFLQEPEKLEHDDAGQGVSANLPAEMNPSILGYIEIPKMKVTLPVYWGASQENLSKGAGILETSSLPIGGINSNCVIAGHRGYRGIPFFQEIELLEEGDLVYLTNRTETLTYMVESIAIVAPTDSDAVAVQEGKDMITLLTCHPYRSHGRQRYLVYCIRKENCSRTEDRTLLIMGEEGESEKAELQNGSEVHESTVETIPSSREDIQREHWLRRGGLVMILSLLLLSGLQQRKREEIP